MTVGATPRGFDTVPPFGAHLLNRLVGTTARGFDTGTCGALLNRLVGTTARGFDTVPPFGAHLLNRLVGTTPRGFDTVPPFGAHLLNRLVGTTPRGPPSSRRRPGSREVVQGPDPSQGLPAGWRWVGSLGRLPGVPAFAGMTGSDRVNP